MRCVTLVRVEDDERQRRVVDKKVVECGDNERWPVDPGRSCLTGRGMQSLVDCGLLSWWLAMLEGRGWVRVSYRAQATGTPSLYWVKHTPEMFNTTSSSPGVIITVVAVPGVC